MDKEHNMGSGLQSGLEALPRQWPLCVARAGVIVTAAVSVVGLGSTLPSVETAGAATSGETCAPIVQDGKVVGENCSQSDTSESTNQSGSTGPTRGHSTPPRRAAPRPHHNKPGHHNSRHSDTANGRPNSLSMYYSNPLRDIMRNRSLEAHRIDMGVDYGGHGKIFAMGDGVVTVATRNSRFWGNEGGEATVYRLTKGPARGRSVFVSESCTPRVHVGQPVHRNTVICNMHGDNNPWMETGWARRTRGRGSDVPAAWSTQYVPAGHHDGSKTAFGVNFSHFLGKLGAPEGNTRRGHVSWNPRITIGRVPRQLAKLVTLKSR